MVAAAGFWILLIPLFAVYFGGIPYLILAGPGFWLVLRRYPPNPLIFAGIGFALNLLSPVIYAIILVVIDMPFDFEAIRIFWFYGAVFASIWGAVFALLYRLFRYLLAAGSLTAAPD